MKVRMGMIGGGEGSFIGPVHRIAAAMDDSIELVSAALSSNPVVARESGLKAGLPESRVYTDWKEMLSSEKNMPVHTRPEIISIVTPNWLHAAPAIEALNAGFHVICDKPLSMSLKEARDIEEAVTRNGSLFCVTHTYTGYPAVKQARDMIINGEIGVVRKIVAIYMQGWLTEKEEDLGNRQAEWRTDPDRAGLSGCMGDIGVHAFQLAEYVTGLKSTSLFASLNRVVDGRNLDDDGTVMIEYHNGARGTLLASQVATGEENNFSLSVYGTKGSITWKQMEPNSLVVRWKDRPMQVYRSGAGYPEISGGSALHHRLPAGHPEGFIEAFANLYRNFAMAVASHSKGTRPAPAYDYPGIEDAVRGMMFLDAAVRSSNDKHWVEL